jgi:hypothetical protein
MLLRKVCSYKDSRGVAIPQRRAFFIVTNMKPPDLNLSLLSYAVFHYDFMDFDFHMSVHQACHPKNLKSNTSSINITIIYLALVRNLAPLLTLIFIGFS